MSPFSELLYRLRCRHDVRQAELADKLGYEQSYISALEIGIKGPPTEEFVERLAAALPLTPEERRELRTAVDESNRKLILEGDASSEHFRFVARLRRKLHSATPRQLRLMSEILDMPDVGVAPHERPLPRIKRRRTVREAPM